MTNLESAALWDRLRGEVAWAEREHARIQDEMERMLREVETGIPLADGQYQRMKAGVKARAAFEEFERAIKRFREYVEHGIVPDDLKETNNL